MGRLYPWPWAWASSWSWDWAPVRWPDFFSFSIVDEALWMLITVVESVALVSMLCFFFVFCGCNL
ncbi:unnamed protein product [Victoria cruziana]